jgi:membrane-associated protease RseP (regulator of RpoE activity)
MSEQAIDYLRTRMSIDDVGGSLTVRRVRGTIHPPILQTIREIKEYFSHTEYTPLFKEENGQHIIQFGVYQKQETQPKYWLNLLLFIATIFSTVFAGSLNSGGNPFANPSDLILGIPFSLSIMTILTCHELGHYFISRKEGMMTTLPYFIPMPLHFIGTFGAIIRMKSIVPSRKSLLKVGMSGPLAGFVVALPITVLGIYLSEIRIAPETEGALRLGDSLLFWVFARLIHTSIPPGHDLFLHPVAFAGWLGLFVTSMNLIPIGQLDGGHVAFSLFLRKRRYLYIPIFAGLVALGLLWFGWYIWALVALFIARRDPVIQDAITPLSTKQKIYSAITFVILVMTFVPQPFVIQGL